MDGKQIHLSGQARYRAIESVTFSVWIEIRSPGFAFNDFRALAILADCIITLSPANFQTVLKNQESLVQIFTQDIIKGIIEIVFNFWHRREFTKEIIV